MTALLGKEFGNLSVAKVDSTGKRAVCVCACRNTLEVSVTALVDGTVSSCGCKPHTTTAVKMNADARAQARREKYFLVNRRPGR
jgi:hypothetical protein